MLSEHLDRWIYASCSKTLNARLTSGFITHYEGLNKDSDPIDGVEFRLDGPRRLQVGKREWQIWVAVNILFQHTIDSKDLHKRFRIAGKIATALSDNIPVHKWGNGIEDNGDFIGCLQVIHDKFNRIQPNHFGQIEKNLKLEQGTVEAHYQMFLMEETTSGTN